MRLIDADKLPYSNIKTNEYGYVETTKTVVLEEDIACAQTVQAIPLDRIKQEREKQANKSIQSLYNEKYIYAVKILDKLISESET